MIKKIITLITLSILIGSAAIFVNNLNDKVPVGAIKISNKVNGNFLAVKELSLLEHASRIYVSLVDGQENGIAVDKAGSVILGNNNLKSICWLPITQPDKTTVLQYVCAGRYHNYYLGIEDDVKSDEYLRLIVRKEKEMGFNWNVNLKEDGAFTYDNSGALFKGYYIAVKDDGIAKVYFGDIGPSARWYQNTHQVVGEDSGGMKGSLSNYIEKIVERVKA